MKDIISIKVRQFNTKYNELRDKEEELNQLLLDIEIRKLEIQKEMFKVGSELDKMDRHVIKDIK